LEWDAELLNVLSTKQKPELLSSQLVQFDEETIQRSPNATNASSQQALPSIQYASANNKQSFSSARVPFSTIRSNLSSGLTSWVQSLAVKVQVSSTMTVSSHAFTLLAFEPITSTTKVSRHAFTLLAFELVTSTNQNSSAKTALKATAEMQPSVDSNKTNNALSFSNKSASALQLVVAFIANKFSNGSNQPSANNSRQCRLFVTRSNKCRMEINKTQTNNSWQYQSFVDVLIDLWQQKCQMEINKTETNNFRQCRLFVNVSIDSWQQKCQMEINKTETNNFWQCQSFVNVSIDSWQHTCQMEINKNEMNKSRQ
jgi:hypothetical protein